MWQGESRANFYQPQHDKKSEINDSDVCQAAFAGKSNLVGCLLRLLRFHEALFGVPPSGGLFKLA
jgi:hypothetical protein